MCVALHQCCLYVIHHSSLGSKPNSCVFWSTNKLLYSHSAIFSVWCRENTRKLKGTTNGPWKYTSQNWDQMTPMLPRQRTTWHHATWNRASTRRLRSCTNRCWHERTSENLAPLMVSDNLTTLISYLSSISFIFPTTFHHLFWRVCWKHLTTSWVKTSVFSRMVLQAYMYLQIIS